MLSGNSEKCVQATGAGNCPSGKPSLSFSINFKFLLLRSSNGLKLSNLETLLDIFEIKGGNSSNTISNLEHVIYQK